MHDEEYKRQIEEAQRLIEGKIRKSANNHGIKINEMKWRKEKIPSTNYILMIETETKKGEYPFSAEQLADFPAEIRDNTVAAITITRYIDAIIRELQE